MGPPVSLGPQERGAVLADPVREEPGDAPVAPPWPGDAPVVPPCLASQEKPSKGMNLPPQTLKSKI